MVSRGLNFNVAMDYLRKNALIAKLGLFDWGKFIRNALTAIEQCITQKL